MYVECMLSVASTISLEVSQAQLLLQESLIQFRNVTPDDVLEAVPV